MNRKDFLLSTLGLVGASLLGGCDDGGGSGGTGGTGGGNGGNGAGGGNGGNGGGGTTNTGSEGGGGSGTTSSATTTDTGTGTGTETSTSFDCTNGTDATIGTNHGHEIVVSAADVAAAADKTYDIKGTSIHTHTVTITAAQFAQLAAGETVMVTSSTDSQHSHSVTVLCGA